MADDLFHYLELLELLAFFSAYPLIYAIVQVKPNRLIKLLPYAYALCGTLFTGFILKELYTNYSSKNIFVQFYHPFLITWGIIAALFWIKPFNRKPIISLLHSLVFFFFLARHIITQQDNIKNDMRVFTDSLLLNAACLAAVTISFYAINYFRRK